MNGINPDTFKAILLQIVKDVGYEAGLRLNAYASVDNFPDLRAPAFGKSYEEYLAGRYWSRDWYNGGKDSAKMVAEFPALFVEWRDVELEHPADLEGATPFNLYLVDKIECETCPDRELRTPEYLTRSTNRTLRMVLRELYTYGLYEVDRGGTITWEWLSKGRADYWVAEGIVDDAALITDLEGGLQADPIRVKQYTNLPDFRVAHTVITLHWCEDEINENFNYQDTVVADLAYTVCPC